MYGMLQGTSINEIIVVFTDWSNTYDFTYGINNSGGTFYKPSTLPEEYGEYAIPEGWNVVNI
jgi:hypothetical protein